MVNAAIERTGQQSIFRRVARNVGWLAGARGFTAVASLAYLAIAARALGLQDFGRFTLVLTYGQLIANLVQFQSWKGVIRYGAAHAAVNDRNRLGRLFGFAATLDCASAVIGLTLVIITIPLIGPLLHWNAVEQRSAAVFGGFLLLMTGATSSGMLRLFDRFDLMAYNDAAGPLVRLLGSAAIWAAGGGVESFLVVWAAAAATQFIGQWIAALFAYGSWITLGRSAFVTAIQENRRILRFMVQTNLANSLGLFWMQLGTLAVGAVAGPAEAGGFRIAQRLAKAIAKPMEPITRALYPELARLVADREHATVRRVLVRISAIAAGLSALVVLITGLAGGEIVRLVAGAQFAFAHSLLFLLSIAAAIELTGFALEPFHLAHGRTGRVLRSRAVGAMIYLILLALLLRQTGGEGAATAAICASLVIVVQLGISAAQILRRTTCSETAHREGDAAGASTEL